MMADEKPQAIVITVAPNGSYKTRSDHPNLPLTPAQLAETAQACLDAGAAMIHLHIRDAKGRHSLSTDLYRTMIETIQKKVGNELVIQITTESAGVFTLESQIRAVKEIVPESASIAISELLSDKRHFEEVKKFFNWLLNSSVTPQFILYNKDDVLKYQDLISKGILGTDRWPVLFVLGQHIPQRDAVPEELQLFLEVYRARGPWSISAFGSQENLCVINAASLGGHVRVGFENNMLLENKELADDNAALVKQFVETSKSLARPLATADQLREMWMFK